MTSTTAGAAKATTERATLDAILERSTFCPDCGDRVFVPDEFTLTCDVPHKPSPMFMLKGDKVFVTPGFPLRRHTHKTYNEQRVDDDKAWEEHFGGKPGGTTLSTPEASDRYHADPRYFRRRHGTDYAFGFPKNDQHLHDADIEWAQERGEV